MPYSCLPPWGPAAGGNPAASSQAGGKQKKETWWTRFCHRRLGCDPDARARTDAEAGQAYNHPAGMVPPPANTYTPAIVSGPVMNAPVMDAPVVTGPAPVTDVIPCPPAAGTRAMETTAACDGYTEGQTEHWWQRLWNSRLCCAAEPCCAGDCGPECDGTDGDFTPAPEYDGSAAPGTETPAKQIGPPTEPAMEAPAEKVAPSKMPTTKTPAEKVAPSTAPATETPAKKVAPSKEPTTETPAEKLRPVPANDAAPSLE
jgi:hypothetical protein